MAYQYTEKEYHLITLLEKNNFANQKQRVLFYLLDNGFNWLFLLTAPKLKDFCLKISLNEKSVLCIIPIFYNIVGDSNQACAAI